MKIPEPEKVLRERGVAPEGIHPGDLEKARFLHAERRNTVASQGTKTCWPV